jgi:hypothetical protein
VLNPVAGRKKKPVLVKYDPRNLSRVFWQDSQGHYWPVPYHDLRLPPTSLWEQLQTATSSFRPFVLLLRRARPEQDDIDV